MSAPVDLLALGAHPDDVEVGCGGALLLAGEAGLRTAIVDFTAGERSSRGTPAVRLAERDAATARLGVAERQSLGLDDGQLTDSAAAREALIEAIRGLRPKAVLAPLPHDRHPDHAAVGQVARAACFLAGVASIGATSPHRPTRLYHYLFHHSTPPSFVIDITRVWEGKWSAISAYRSQFGNDPQHGSPTALSTGTFLRAVDARSIEAGAMVGVERGEPYWSPGPLAAAQVPGMDVEPRTYRSFL